MRGFLFGTVVGALVAVLVAPRRGEETREMVRARLGLWQDQLTARLDRLAADVESMRRDVMVRLEDIRAQFAGGGQVGGEMGAPPSAAPESTPRGEEPPKFPTPES